MNVELFFVMFLISFPGATRVYSWGYIYSEVLIRYLVKILGTENRNALSKTISPNCGDYCSQKKRVSCAYIMPWHVISKYVFMYMDYDYEKKKYGEKV